MGHQAMGLTGLPSFHRYYPAGLGRSRCGLCGGGITDEVHIAGLNEESTGTHLVQCPNCGESVPTDFTVRVFVKETRGLLEGPVQRLCRTCASDPDAGREAAEVRRGERSKADQLARLMNRLDRGEITQEQYEAKMVELL
jgi:hypothetical protein